MTPDRPGLSPTAVARVAAAVVQADQPPGQIGRYRLVQVIGEGGMGQVWRAEQEQPIRRTVALKLIKLGMDSRQIIARFESERQALALMNHPNVAKVLDAGTSDGGRPYFVMEYVPGEPITTFCDRHRYTTRQRLELFIQACDAVRHAHQKAIIHRDIKPSNLLVMLEDGKPLVKVIDFGVAKAVGQPLTERTLFTEQGQFVGTPEFMSPEQAEMNALDVDTRSDTYSLGVVLYELLTGALPFDPKVLRNASLAEIQRIIREVEPPRPSTRLSKLGEGAAKIADRRQVRLEELHRQLRGELEWIPLKAMRKDRAQRYATASEFAQDIENYLEHRPLLAGPESKWYRLRKLVRRRRVEVVAGSLVAVSLLAGMIGTLTFAVRESQQRAQAEKNAEETRQVAEFQAEMLSGLDVQQMGLGLRQDLLAETEQTWRYSNLGEEEIARRRAELEALLAGSNFTNPAIRILERNILDRALAEIEKQFAAQPLVKARLLQHVANALRNLTRLEPATKPQADALEIRRRHLGDDHPDTLESMAWTGLLLAAKGKWVEAEPIARQVLDRRCRVLPEDDRLILSAKRLLAEVLQRQQRHAEAEPYRRDVMDGSRRTLGDDDPDTLDAILLYGQVLLWEERLVEAEPYICEAIAGMERVYDGGGDHWRPRKAKVLLGALRSTQGRLPEALKLVRVAYEGTRAAYGDHHRDTLFCVVRLGGVLRMQRRFTDAEPYLQRAIDGFRKELGDEHYDTLHALLQMSALRQAQGDFPKAEACLNEALDGIRRKGPLETHPQSAWVLSSLGNLLAQQGKLDEAAKLHRQAVEIGRNTLPATHMYIANGLGDLGSVLRQQGKLAEAEKVYREAVELRRNAGPAGKAGLARALTNLGLLRAQQGEVTDAEQLYREALYIRRATFGAHADTAWTLEYLAGAIARQGRLAVAEPLYREMLEMRRKVLPAGDPETLRSLGMLAWIRRAQRDLTEAESLYREALRGYRDTGREDHPLAIGTMTGLARVLWMQDRLEEADPLFAEALARRLAKDDHNRTLLARRDLGRVRWAQGRLEEAQELLQERLAGRRQAFGITHVDTAIALVDMALLRADQGRLQDAEPLLAELQQVTGAPELSPQVRARTLWFYGCCLVLLERYAEAEKPLRQARDHLRQTGIDADGYMRNVVDYLATVCQATGRPDEAARWRDELAAIDAIAGPFRIDLNPRRWSRTPLKAVMSAYPLKRNLKAPTTRAAWAPMYWDH